MDWVSGCTRHTAKGNGVKVADEVAVGVAHGCAAEIVRVGFSLLLPDGRV